MNSFTPSLVLEGQSVLVSFGSLYYSINIQSQWRDPKHAKSWIFFHLMEPSRSNKWENRCTELILRLLTQQYMVWHTLVYHPLGTLIYAGKLAVKQEQKFAHGTEVRFDCVEGQKRSWKIVCFNGRWVGLSLGCDENGQPQGGSQVFF